MKLTLDETQRLNLHTIIGGQRGTVDELRLFWRLQDKIALTDEEKEHIQFKSVQNNGNVTVTWDTRLLTKVEFELKDDEEKSITKIFKDGQIGFAAYDRMWLEPLLAQFTS